MVQDYIQSVLSLEHQYELSSDKVYNTRDDLKQEQQRWCSRDNIVILEELIIGGGAWVFEIWEIM